MVRQQGITMTREASIETYLRERVKAAGGLCIKLNPAGYVGIPDRLVLLPGGVVVFVEVKKPRNARVARLQEWWRDNHILRLGFAHCFVFTREDVDTMMEVFG
jgi:hypothetical protein